MGWANSPGRPGRAVDRQEIEADVGDGDVEARVAVEVGEHHPARLEERGQGRGQHLEVAATEAAQALDRLAGDVDGDEVEQAVVVDVAGVEGHRRGADREQTRRLEAQQTGIDHAVAAGGRAGARARARVGGRGRGAVGGARFRGAAGGGAVVGRGRARRCARGRGGGGARVGGVGRRARGLGRAGEQDGE
jgi:hypothetical protein